MIPKVIHYCWFGSKKIPKLEKKCIRSWHKHCPDYKIILWNESNFNIEQFMWTKEAYEAKKYAFVADFVRLYVLTQFGGIYLDTDIQIIKSLDSLLQLRGFTGFESEKLINAGIMGGEANNFFLKTFLNFYCNMHFANEDGSLNTISIPSIITSICLKNGFVINNSYQNIEGFAIFPNDFFYPKDFRTGFINISKNTYSIHHYTASWFTKKQKKQLKKSWKKAKQKRLLIKLFGINVFNYFNKLRKTITKL